MKNRRRSKTYFILATLHVTSFYLMLIIASEWSFQLLTISYFLTSFLFLLVGKCPFEIAVQFNWKDYIKACRRIYGVKFPIAVIGYGSYPLLWLLCLIDYLIKN